MINLITIYKSRNQILEGIKNNMFKKSHVEEIAKERFDICKLNNCKEYDFVGTKCMVPGTHPCCGSCGCSLTLKTRALSADCPKGLWGSILTEKEEDLLNDKIKHL